MGFPYPITYYFFYDSTSRILSRINIDSLEAIIIEVLDDTVQMTVFSPGSYNFKYKAEVNSNKQILSVWFRDSTESSDRQYYYFNYSGAEIDSMGAPIIYVAPYCDYIFKESDPVFDGQNYIQLDYSHTMFLSVSNCLYQQGSVAFEYTTILNSLQLPFQFIFTLSANGGVLDYLQFDPLYVYGLMGYTACKPNHNLLDQVSDRKYSYLFDENNRVSDMAITDTLTDQVLYQYRLTYY